MIVFIDQSGQLGGAELCLSDLAVHRRKTGRVLLFSEGPFADHLRQRGVATDILPLPAPATCITKGASLLNLAAGLPAQLSHTLAVRKHIRRADLVYFNTAKALMYGTAANLLQPRPSVFHLHDILNPRHFSRANIHMLVAAANRARLVIANSRATEEAFAEAGGRTRCEVVPNGFDPAPFDAVTPEQSSALRAELNPDNRPVAALFGRLARWKGQDVLLRAAAKLPDLEIWIVGDALFTADDHAYANELRTLAAPLGRRIRFLGFRSDIPALMTAADIIVHCSTAPEPFGRVLVEAMLARRPVIASRAGGPLEILGDHSVGRLFSPGDPGSLEDALRHLLASPAERKELGQAGRIRAETEYALPVMLTRMDAILDQLG
jgi:glycosyltransferase involved in cell wall biosynthesis